MIIGYTAGVFDLTHSGHINLLTNASKFCDRLIVGVNSDRLCEEYKHKRPLMSEQERLTCIKALPQVAMAFVTDERNKLEMWKRLKFNVVFVGDDWYNTEDYNLYELELKECNVKVVYLPYTKGISTTELRERNGL